MHKTRYPFTLAVIIVAGIIGGAISSKMAPLVSTQAQAERATAMSPNKWEYCALTKAVVSPSRGGLFWISYFRAGGVQVEVVEELATERSGQAKAIAKLGEDGWEMIGQGPFEMRQGVLNALYFKRPKS